MVKIFFYWMVTRFRFSEHGKAVGLVETDNVVWKKKNRNFSNVYSKNILATVLSFNEVGELRYKKVQRLWLIKYIYFKG